MSPNGHGLLGVWVSCSLIVVVFYGRRENVYVPNASRGSCLRMLAESLGDVTYRFCEPYE